MTGETRLRDAARPPGVILAGGLSRRMGGGDKALASIAGKPLVARLIERLEPQVSRLAVNANGDPDRFASFGLPVLADRVGEHWGPLAGALTALAWAATGSSHVQLASVDMPFLPRDLSARLLAAAGEADIVAPRARGREHLLCGLWHVGQRSDLEAALAKGIRAVRDWTATRAVAHVDFPAPLYDPFFNVNRPQDLEEAATLAALAD